MVRSYIAEWNRSHFPGFARPCIFLISGSSSREITCLISWVLQTIFNRLSNTFAFIFLDLPLLVRLSWVTARTVALSSGSHAVHLSSGSTAPVCGYRRLFLLGNAFDISVACSRDCSWLIRVAVSVTLFIRCDHALLHKRYSNYGLKWITSMHLSKIVHMEGSEQ